MKGLGSNRSSVIDRHLDNCLLFLSSGEVVRELGVAEVGAGNVVQDRGRRSVFRSERLHEILGNQAESRRSGRGAKLGTRAVLALRSGEHGLGRHDGRRTRIETTEKQQREA